jgi:uncharacterized protein (DUF2141 family)
VGLILAAIVGRALGEESSTVAISGRVVGSSRAHTVHVALWDADGFLRKPSQEVRVAAGVEPRFRFVVRPGRWAVSAYEDKNENGVLDMGLLGPKEPSGFWRAFRAWRKPRFDDVAVQVDRDTDGADVTLR